MTYLGRHGRRLLAKVDATGHGIGDRRQQLRLQSGLVAVLETAMSGAGLDRSSWTRHDAGGGELAIHHEDDPCVVDAYVRDLHAALARYNLSLDPAVRLRLRLAVHFGAATRRAEGFAGRGVAAVNRLAGCEQLKNALRARDGDLAVIISDEVHHAGALSEEDLRQVTVVSQGFRDRAWIHVPGQDVHSLDLRSSVELALTHPSQVMTRPNGLHARFQAPVDALAA